ncbi:hypothetical protein ACJJTC_000405 [Scirpophaga incertulas]
MECDSVHAAIERKLKNGEIHILSDFISVTLEARKNPTPYEAIHVDYSLVKDFSDKSTWRYNSIRPGRKAGDQVVVDIRAIKYSPEQPIPIASAKFHHLQQLKAVLPRDCHSFYDNLPYV